MGDAKFVPIATGVCFSATTIVALGTGVISDPATFGIFSIPLVASLLLTVRKFLRKDA